MLKKILTENEFFPAPGGMAGTVNYQPGAWAGTHASPDVRQNSAHFAKSLGSHSNTATGAPADGSALDAEVDQLYNKKDTPTPDEVMTGIKYEMQNMIKKDKARAKEIVLGNLQQDPHYYSKLGMWNIDDKEMMKVEPVKQTQDDVMKERVDILNRMIAEKAGKKAETPKSYMEALAETKAKRDARYKH